MSANLPIAAVLNDLTRQIEHWQRQEELHAEQAEHHGRQQLFHQERREEAAAELEVLRARHEAFRAAAEAAGEVVGRPTGDAAPAAAAAADEPDLPRVRRTGRVVLIRLLAEVIQGKPPDESFTHASLAREVQARFGHRLRQRVDPRSVSSSLRRLAARGTLETVREGTSHVPAVYRRSR
jgi:hypothetical protein